MLERSSSKTFVGLDWDLTAFRTVPYHDQVLDVVQQHFPDHDHDDLRHNSNNFRLQYGHGNIYDFPRHLQSVGIEFSKVEELVVAELKSDKWLMPGTVEFIKTQIDNGNDLHVITQGILEHQGMKIRCTELGEMMLAGTLSVHAIQEPKGSYIARAFPDSQGYMVDDVEVTELPDGVQWIPMISHKSQHRRTDAHVSPADLLRNGPTELRPAA